MSPELVCHDCGRRGTDPFDARCACGEPRWFDVPGHAAWPPDWDADGEVARDERVVLVATGTGRGATESAGAEGPPDCRRATVDSLSTDLDSVLA